MGCGLEPQELALDADGATRSQAVVVGNLEWTEIGEIASGTAERENAKSVGLLDLPASGGRCSAFLIAPDVVMTNAHCVSSQADAVGAAVSFGFQYGSSDVLTYACDTFIGGSTELDYGLLRCANRPGDRLGVLELTAAKASSASSVYVVQNNCDYYADADCLPTKKIARGKVVSNRASATEIAHDADTFAGSSGSPVFSATHAVIALHHAGLGQGFNGRGAYNLAVEMKQILPELARRFPNLGLGARAPAEEMLVTPPAAAAVADDAAEPNNTREEAFTVRTPSEAQFSMTGDEDWFKVTPGAASRTVRIDFDHTKGDLDLYVYNASGRELAKSEGQGDAESITRTFTSGTFYVRVVGYEGATGAYTLSMK